MFLRENLVNFTFEWLCDFDRQTDVVFKLKSKTEPFASLNHLLVLKNLFEENKL